MADGCKCCAYCVNDKLEPFISKYPLARFVVVVVVVAVVVAAAEINNNNNNNNSDDDDNDDDDDNNSSSSSSSNDDNNNNNDNNNRFQRHSSTLFTISSLRRELSPTRTLKWPGRNRVQISCNTSSAYHVQVVVLSATWYETTAQLLSLTELKSHLF